MKNEEATGNYDWDRHCKKGCWLSDRLLIDEAKGKLIESYQASSFGSQSEKKARE